MLYLVEVMRTFKDHRTETNYMKFVVREDAENYARRKSDTLFGEMRGRYIEDFSVLVFQSID